MASYGARALVALCPGWPVMSVGRPPSALVAVVEANRVVAVSPAAGAADVRVGMRRREAESCCPGLGLLSRDLAGESRRWEQAVAAVEEFAPGVEVLQPGWLALGARGPARYFGGDLALAAKVAAAVEEAASRDGAGAEWAGFCRVGVADGLFAAQLAAGTAAPGEPVVVPRGASAGFLAPFPLQVLATPQLAALAGAGGAGTGSDGRFAALVDLLQRLGLRTLGDFAALPPPRVLGRFGTEGLLAHRLARGLSERPVRGRVPPPDWVVASELDPPAEQLQAAVFVGRALAERLHQRLAGEGLVCTRLAIEVETVEGATFRRSWRHDGALSAAAIGERVRWQLEGWAQGPATAGGGPAPREGQGGQARFGPVVKLALVPEEVRPDTGRQLGLWGAGPGAAARTARALARVQGLLGPEAAFSAVLQGGRDYKEQVRLVPWGEPREPLRAGGGGGTVRQGSKSATARSREGPPPWPGRLPGLAPATVHCSPLPAEVLDRAGRPVGVAGRGTISAPPVSVAFRPATSGHGGPAAPGGGEAPASTVVAWAGPWPLEERWWDAGRGRRRARLQVCTEGGAAYLLVREKGSWWVEATYD